MGEIKLFHNYKLSFFFHIPGKLEYYGNVQKNRYVTLSLGIRQHRRSERVKKIKTVNIKKT